MVELSVIEGDLDEAIELCSANDVQAAIERLSQNITERLAGANPVVLCVLNGGVVFTGQLLPHLPFPLELDYLHVTRYRGKNIGAEIEWVVTPRSDLAGRTVLIIDDIFDQGFTLEAIVEYCRRAGAEKVYSTVLVEKQHRRAKAPLRPDFVGLTTSDLYVFGAGMDYRGYWRNAPGIYGIKI